MTKKKKSRPGQADGDAPTGTVPEEMPGGNNAASGHPKKSESGGPKGPEPTRYGDWERDGRCVDF